MELDGRRRWIRPTPAYGTKWQYRRAVAYALMAIYFVVPFLRWQGQPVFLFDLPHRRFHFFGQVFLPTDTLLLMLLFASGVIFIFLLTALFGRAWCGWACPQTVYLEFLYRPIERLFEGGAAGSRQMDKAGGFHWRRAAKYPVYLLISLFVTHTLLSYFVGTDQLREWVTQSPSAHPTAFFLMALSTLIVFLNFSWFREQTCLIVCPYGRWQSVLLDKQSLVVAYDYNRGEPRGRGKAREGLGDCIECGACTATCPTGIDIRNGVQMECVHCTQCADACDAIMRKVGKPEGLVRYTSRDALAGKARHLLRARTILYPAAFSLTFGGFLVAIATKDAADVTLLRGVGAPFTVMADGRVSNQLRVKIANRTLVPQRYTITLEGAGVDRALTGADVIAPENPLAVEPTETKQTSVFLVLPRAAFAGGAREVTIRVSDGADFARNFTYRVLGPVGDGASGAK
jgi:cytochrome c oxidase accessory protein FixG